MFQAVAGSLVSFGMLLAATFFTAFTSPELAPNLARASPKLAACQVRPPSEVCISTRVPGAPNTVAMPWSLSIRSTVRNGVFSGIPDPGTTVQLAPKSLLVTRPKKPFLFDPMVAHCLPAIAPSSDVGGHSVGSLNTVQDRPASEV